MRLADFITANTESILREWDVFARSIWPDAKVSQLLLRDHAEAILRAAARDMVTPQTAPEQSEKAKGGGGAGPASATLDTASKDHALDRVTSGFDLMELVAEYRALRASVVRLWTEAAGSRDAQDVIDLTRFNEAIDQSLSEAVRHFSEQMDRSREMLLSVMGHDLRNPLNAMLLSARALLETCDGEAVVYATQITTSGEAVARMLADFLDLTASRLGRGLPIARADSNLADIAVDVVNECRASAPDRKIGLDLQGNLKGHWDAGRLRQLLSNLIGNAIQHGTHTVPIQVTVKESGAQIILQVHNGGAPISEDDLPKIFEPLYQGAASKRAQHRRSGSMGLGLYIAREVATAHGGSIEAKSSLAAGTMFTVNLPCDHAALKGG